MPLGFLPPRGRAPLTQMVPAPSPGPAQRPLLSPGEQSHKGVGQQVQRVFPGPSGPSESWSSGHPGQDGKASAQGHRSSERDMSLAQAPCPWGCTAAEGACSSRATSVPTVLSAFCNRAPSLSQTFDPQCHARIQHNRGLSHQKVKGTGLILESKQLLYQKASLGAPG